MLTRRLCATFAVAVAALLALPGVAAAAPGDYPAEPVRLTASQTVVGSGGVFVARGVGFVPGEAVSIDVTYRAANNAAARGGMVVQPAALVTVPAAYVKTVTAAGDGSFATPIRLVRVGRATITATGASGRTAVISVRVLPAGSNSADENDSATGNATGDEGLPRTGTDVGVVVAVGALSVALGGVLVWFTLMRRRRHTTPA
jgi:LPXTG-motif cell wall-anchored protein